MEQLGALPAPGQLPGQLHEHEAFQQGAERPAGPQQAPAPAPSRSAANPESTKASLGVSTARALTFRDQAGIRLIRKTSSSRATYRWTYGREPGSAADRVTTSSWPERAASKRIK